MDLIPKCPVQNPCEAQTFDEAAWKNRARLSCERDVAKGLHEDMKRDGDAGAEAVDPAFWVGAMAANEQAWLIYRTELAEFHKRVAEKVSRAIAGGAPKLTGAAWKSGWDSIGQNWVKALEKNDPSVIVYW